MIGAQVTPQPFAVKAAVGVGHEGIGDGVNARIALHLARAEFGQFAVITFRQVFANLTQLFFDKVKVIHQPFGGGRNFLSEKNGIGQRAISRCQAPSVGFELRQ